MRKLSLVLIALLLAVSAAAQSAPQACSSMKPDEKKAQRPSPPGCTDAKFSDGKMLVITYSRPKVNDPKTQQPRVVWGQLVPWGEPWRMGANEATTFVTDTNLNVGGTSVPAGSYTLYLQPEQSGAWKLIINKTTGQWGIPYPGAASDFARIDVKTSKTPSTVQQFTIKLDPPKGNSTKLNLDWENTRATVDVKEAK
jgi:hypothetical protein